MSENKNQQELPSPKSFGIVFSIIFILIELYLYFFHNTLLLYFLILSIILLVISFFKPSLLKVPNILWYKFGIFISKITNPMILFFIFYIIISPFSFLIRVLKGDLLKKKFIKNINTYWEVRENKINSMKDQF